MMTNLAKRLPCSASEACGKVAWCMVVMKLPVLQAFCYTQKLLFVGCTVRFEMVAARARRRPRHMVM